MSKLDRLTEYRLSKGYKTAKAFAEFLEISPSQISEIDKKGKAAALLLALETKTDININWLETGEGVMLDPFKRLGQFIGIKSAVSQEGIRLGEQLLEYETDKIYKVTEVIRQITSQEEELLICWERMDEGSRHTLIDVARALANKHKE